MPFCRFAIGAETRKKKNREFWIELWPSFSRSQLLTVTSKNCLRYKQLETTAD
jgi:hypothetical protein